MFSSRQEEEEAEESVCEQELGPKATCKQPSFQEDEHQPVPPLPDVELQNEMEHVLEMRPSRHTALLSEKAPETDLDLFMKSAVAKLDNSLAKMERLAQAADTSAN